ncbi:MAG TPA: glycoside hydrolase family 38 C-terminal domain-containing protein, partial [Acidimicrobiia bacterium]|nr:glycoside hydrolase family 38 C-terminal domain-containing protein [Acidimicrobiia bacterium]
AERNYADHGGGTRSMAPFGYGNGGGGPTREMMERYRRMRDLEGLPTLDIESPAEFFAKAAADYPNAPRWVGELYFEMHRGTYTSQAKMEAGNRRCEILLGEVELWSTIAHRLGLLVYPAEVLRAAWREVLTLQFHDIIPGSSIAWVHDDAETTHARWEEVLTIARDEALAVLSVAIGGDVTLANSAPDDRAEVVMVHAPDTVVAAPAQRLADGRIALWADIPAMGVAGVEWSALHEAPAPCAVEQRAGDIVMSNHLVRVTIDGDGLIASVYDLRADREVVKRGHRANMLELSADHPIEYDAWDLDEYYANSTVDLTDATSIEIVDRGPLLTSTRVVRSFGRSRIEQLLVLRAGSARIDIVNDVSWHEDEKVLKVAMPVDVHAESATCEIQFGSVSRPTHASTSWDAAKFEVCAHRWVDVSEHGYGVALLNDSKYGHDLHRGALRLTLLRASNFPDPDADRGDHHFTYSLFPHLGDHVEGAVVAEAARLNQPIVALAAAGERMEPAAPWSVASTSNRSVVVTAVKFAEDGSGDVIVRCYEASGGRANADLFLGFDVEAVKVCDLLERALDDEVDAASIDGDAIRMRLRPFQILTLRVR